MNSLEIKGARARLGLTQNQVASELGISTASYQKKESGLIQFSDSEKIKLSELFGWNMIELNDFLYDGKLPIGKCQDDYR